MTTAFSLDTAGLGDAGTYDRSVQRVIDFARRHLDMDVVWVSDFAGGQQVLEHVAADVDDRLAPRVGAMTGLEGSFCLRVLDGRLTPVVQDARRNLVTRSLSVTDDLAIGSYIGVPLPRPDGQVHGMLCGISHQPRPELGSRDVATLELLAALLSDLAGRDSPLASRHDSLRQRVLDMITGTGRRTALQPIVEVATGEQIAVEALTRFSTGTPDMWFADARAVGLLEELEIACARTALKELDRDDLPSRLTVNLSPLALMSAACTEMLAAVDRRRLVIEITEHAPVDDYEALREALSPHRDAGALIAIDDAGAGYASFRHVLQLNPDFVKVDIGIIRGIDLDLTRQSLLTALQTLATGIGAHVIAEGVESAAELQTLRRLHVPLAQGYLIGRPV